MLGVPPTIPMMATSTAPDPGTEPEPDAPRGAGADVEPDPPALEFAARTAASGGSVVPVPPLAGLPARSAIRLLEARGLLADVDGSGRVTSQSPAAGRMVDRGSRVRLTLAPPG